MSEDHTQAKQKEQGAARDPERRKPYLQSASNSSWPASAKKNRSAPPRAVPFMAAARLNTPLRPWVSPTKSGAVPRGPSTIKSVTKALNKSSDAP